MKKQFVFDEQKGKDCFGDCFSANFLFCERCKTQTKGGFSVREERKTFNQE